jgi:hypothetical protein
LLWEFPTLLAKGAILISDCWSVERCCQTNANQSLFSIDLNLLGCAEAAPLGKSGGAVQLEI